MNNDGIDSREFMKFSTMIPEDHLEIGKYTFLQPLSEKVEALIGRTIAAWGAYEAMVDEALRALSLQEIYDLPKGWEMRSYKKRICLMLKIIDGFSEDIHPNLSQAFHQLAVEAERIQSFRNILAHGHYEPIPGAPTEGGYIGKYRAKSARKDLDEPISLDVETLKLIWHDAAHLAGAMVFLLERSGFKISPPPLVLPDKQLLSSLKSESFPPSET
jgi:hypothetical protein